MQRFALTTCLILAVAWTNGCGAPEPPGAAPAAIIKGTITMDDKPVPTGEIHFGMAGVPPRVLQITNGTFSGEAPIGKNQVEVFVFVEGPRSEKYSGTPTKTNIVPEKYFGPQTTLEATVKASGNEDFKFEITSK